MEQIGTGTHFGVPFEMTGQQTQPKAKARPIMVACAMSAALFVLGTRHATSAGLPCSYEVAAIIQAPDGPFGLASPTIGTGISPNGRYVCGFYNPGAIGNNRAFVYDAKTSQFTPLPNPAGISISSAQDVNDAGQVVGEHGGSAGDFGFIYDLNTGQYTQLPPLDPVGVCGINAINSQGVVCGFRSIDDGGSPGLPWNAFIWSPKGGFTDLGVMNGPYSEARDISDDGIVVGSTGTTSIAAITRAFVYDAGRITIFDPVPGAVNSTGRFVLQSGSLILGGTVQASTGLGVVYAYENEGFTQLLPLKGSPTLQIRGASNSGIVVGNSGNAIFGIVPTAWFGATPQNLNEHVEPVSGLSIQWGSAVSDDGHIAAYAYNSADIVVAILTPAQAQPGDTNCDKAVDVDDLLNVINNWGECTDCASDLTVDGWVNVDDLIVVLDRWTL